MSIKKKGEVDEAERLMSVPVSPFIEATNEPLPDDGNESMMRRMIVVPISPPDEYADMPDLVDADGVVSECLLNATTEQRLSAIVPRAKELKRNCDERVPSDWIEGHLSGMISDLRTKHTHTVRLNDEVFDADKEAIIALLFTEDKGYNLSRVKDDLVITFKA